MKKITTAFTVLAFFAMTNTLFAQTATVKNKTAKAFLEMLDGSDKAAEAAIKKFGTEEVIKNGMQPFGKSPKIVKEEGNCVFFILINDGEKNAYNICTEGEKVSSFDWTTE